MSRPALDTAIEWKLKFIEKFVQDESPEISRIVSELAVAPERRRELEPIVRNLEELFREKADLSRPGPGNLLHKWAIVIANLTKRVSLLEGWLTSVAGSRTREEIQRELASLKELLRAVLEEGVPDPSE